MKKFRFLTPGRRRPTPLSRLAAAGFILIFALSIFAACRPEVEPGEGNGPALTSPAAESGTPGEATPDDLSSPEPESDALNGELNEALDRWQAAGIENYRLVVAYGQPTLGCTYEVVDVLEGEVQQAWRGRRLPLCVPRADFGTFDPCELEPADSGKTVEELFETARQYAESAGSTGNCTPTAQITYDETYGFPTLAVLAGPPLAECPTDNVSESAVVAFLPNYDAASGESDPFTACEAAAGGVVSLGEAEGAVFSAQQAQAMQLGWLFGPAVDEYWTPSPDDILALEADLALYWQEEAQKADSEITLRGAGEVLERLPEYTRQYIGFVREGERLIWANFFCNPVDGWQENIVTVLDGGDCYFTVLYEPETGAFSGLNINGES